MSELHQLVRQIAQGTSSQKRRCWLQLFEAGNFWSSCREACRHETSLGELAAAHEALSGPWDREPLRELGELEDEDLDELTASACRTVAAAAVTAIAASPQPNPAMLAVWALRSTGEAPDAQRLQLTGLSGLRGEALIRSCFRELAGLAADRGAVASAQDTAISLLYGMRSNERRAPAHRLRVPVLLARGNEGFLAWLWMERLPEGFGQFFQAPDTRFDPLRRDLRAAVEAAHRFVRNAASLPPDEDVRWWLAGIPGSRAGSAAPVSGASLQAAAAVGLLFLLREQPYNPTCAISATLLHDGRLGAVIGLTGAAPKLRAALRLRTASGQATVVVSPESQPAETTALEWEARGVRVVAAPTVWDAMEHIRAASESASTRAPQSEELPGGSPPDPNTVPETVQRPLPKQQSMPSTPAGVLPLDSRFYVVRPTDGQFAAAIDRQESIVRIRGARQMGKTSLLARGLQQARETGATVVLTDCQMFNAVHLESAETFLSTIARWFIRNLKLETRLDEVWDPLQGPNWNFREFMLFEVLEQLRTPLVWALDEVDRLFTYDFGSEVFGLFRSWHNERALDPAVPWSRLTIAMAHATDAHLFITEPHQSPFNVGERVALQDFTPDEVADLNARYDRPLKSEQELEVYYQLLGGQPYLTHRGLHEMATRHLDLQAITQDIDSGDGIFGEHLRRLVLLLSENQELCDAVREALKGAWPSQDSYQRLWSAGILTGGSPREARLRCELYGRYLERHLP